MIVVLRLFAAQEGLCFHCGKAMDNPRRPASDNYWTREHVYPRSSHRGMTNNVVLAHLRCNQERGCRPPTEQEIAKARALYAGMGLTPFIPANEDNIARSMAGKLRSENETLAAGLYWQDGKIAKVT